MTVKIAFRLCAVFILLPLAWAVKAQAAGEEWGGEVPQAERAGDREIGLSLKSAVELGIRRNLDIVIERYQEQAAAERVVEEEGIFDPVSTIRVDKGENDLPIAETFYEEGFIRNETERSMVGLEGKIPTGGKLGLDFSFEKNKSSSNIQTMSPRYTAKLGLNMVHPLLKDFGTGVTKTKIRLAEKNSEIARYEVQEQVMRTVGAVEQSYWDYTYTLENLELKRQSLDLAKKLFYDTEIMVRAGELPAINLIQARAGIATREEEVITAENQSRKAEQDLKVLLNLADDEMRLVPLDKAEKASDIPEVNASLDQAWENRPDLKGNRLEIDQQKIRVAYAKNQLLPRLDVIAEYGYNGLSGQPSDAVRAFDPITGEPIFAGESVDGTVFQGQTNASDAFRKWFTGDAFDTWLVGLKFEAPLTNRQAKSRYTQASLDEKRVKTELRRLEEQVDNQVRKAILDIQSAVKRMEASGVAVELAQEQLDAEQIKFSAGEATSFDVLVFQRELSELKIRDLMTIMDYNKAWSALRVAEGQSLKQYDIEFE
jgi:outer membrane protein